MKKVSSSTLAALFLAVALTFWSGCGSSDLPDIEEKDPSYGSGRAYLRQGQELEALEEFLSVTRRIVEAPQSHLEAGRLLMKLDERRDPIAAVYHYRRFLELSPDSKEAGAVEQLIVSAEKEIVRKLPGEPYAGHLEAIGLREENERLKRDLADLRVRLGLPQPSPEGSVASKKSSVVNAKPAVPETAPAAPVDPGPVRNYVVQKGDSLYAISRKFFGDSAHIELIFNSNRDVLPNRESLQIGQTLRIPPRPVNR